MRNWLNPWPAIADLFSGLLIATFGGLILFTGHLGNLYDPVQQEANVVQDEVLKALEKNLGGKSSKCGDDICLDVEIQFESDQDGVREDSARRISNACEAVKAALDGKVDRRSDIELSIEGHTDQRPPQHTASERDHFLYNWRLSSARASSVLFEFRSCGVRAPEYQIWAVGHADTRLSCRDDTSECWEKNRRTTFRLRTSKEHIAQRLSSKDTAQ